MRKLKVCLFFCLTWAIIQTPAICQSIRTKPGHQRLLQHSPSKKTDLETTKDSQQQHDGKNQADPKETSEKAAPGQPPNKTQESPETLTVVTLTTYWAKGGPTDHWTANGQSATGTRLREGFSVAVDPEVFPYGSILEIEGVGRRVAKDTGTDVVNRVASTKRGVDFPVVDIYFENRADAQAFASLDRPFARVRVVGHLDLKTLPRQPTAPASIPIPTTPSQNPTAARQLNRWLVTYTDQTGSR
jgi:3D (Asp-Asp-Asp) domain-containing protein